MATITLELQLNDLSLLSEGETAIDDLSTSHFFDEFHEVVGFLLAEDLPLYNSVWLIANGDEPSGEIFITEQLIMGVEFLKPIIEDVVYIQQYNTYEDAYSVALNMRETSEKCYN